MRTILVAFFAGLACALALTRHEPVRQFIGGVRCRKCGKAGATEGELLGLDDAVSVGAGTPGRVLRRVK